MVIRMAVGGDDQADGVQGDPVCLHAPEEMVDMTLMAHINENGLVLSQDVTVAVVLKGILPGIGKYPLFDNHRFSFPRCPAFPKCREQSAVRIHHGEAKSLTSLLAHRRKILTYRRRCCKRYNP